ncbi:MAG: PIN domain-containing protein [Gammaproteobacteria bacterium]|nr:PIN domain-containing protein [Gammaproteobacteria bacterium]
MYLADTSAWINALRRPPRTSGIRLNQLIVAETPVYLAGVVIQEVLQGARDELRLQWYRERLSVQRRVDPVDSFETYAEAARLYARCRWRGYTLGNTVDCLIARLAIEHDLILLHDDADFEKIAQVEPQLKLA